ncbi:MAG: SpoIIE family protein phosphatase [Anaerolineae bacterium]|nr:SpoIIE family protein phosphatase [Anaerolineae bacterium]
MLTVNLQPANGLSWPSLYLFIVAIATTFLILIFMRRFQSRRALMQRVAELEALSGAGRAMVAAELDPDNLCKLIARECGQVIDNRTFQIGLFDGDFYEILFWTIDGKPQETPLTFDLSEESGIIGWIRQNRSPLLINDFLKEATTLPARPRYISDTPPRSAIFLPLISGEAVIGAVTAQSAEPAHFSEEDMRRLMILANQAAAAIAHGRMFEQERQRSAQLELVGRIAQSVSGMEDLRSIFERVVAEIQDAFDFHLVNIFSVDALTGEAVLEASGGGEAPPCSIRLQPGQGLIGNAMSQHVTIVANDVAGDPRYQESADGKYPMPDTKAEIAIPMVADGAVIGVLDVHSPYINAFTQNEKTVLEALAAEIAVAIARGKQLAWQREQAWLTAAQLQVAETIGRGGELGDIVTAVSRLTPMLLGLDFCAILLWDKERNIYKGGDVFGASHRFTAQFQEVRLAIGDWGALDAVHVGHEPITTKKKPPWGRFLPGKKEFKGKLTLHPIDTQNEILGVMVINEMVTVDGETPFARREELLQHILDQAARAIESACLRIAQQEEAWVNAALLQTAEVVNSLFDLNEILDTIVRLVPMLVGVESAIVLIRDDVREIFRPGPSFGISEMGRGLLGSLAIEETEVMDTGIQPAETGTPNANYYAFKPPSWLRKVMNATEAYFFPLNARGKLVGALVVGSTAKAEQTLSLRRINILNGIAHQAATAVVNDHLYKEAAERDKLEQELNFAREIQASLIPNGRPPIPGCSVASFWLAARQVSGDFYDFISLPNDKWGIVIADVADKGVPAALFMALSRTVIRTVAMNRSDPAEVLMRANEILDKDTQSDLFVTVFYAVWNAKTQVLTYANGGHNPPILLGQNGRSHLLTGEGMALGVIPKIYVAKNAVRIDQGDTIIFYTDGVTEAMNEDFDEFGMERLHLIARNNKHKDTPGIVTAITNAVTDHAGATAQFDDITLVVMKNVN